MLDPFEGGGAIPLEAMRLGCDVAAADLNPVAWFLLRCTLTTRRRWPGRAGRKGKDYRPPTAGEVVLACVGKEELDALHAEIPFGLPNEPICPDRPSPNSRGASGLPGYGFDTWRSLFTPPSPPAAGAVLDPDVGGSTLETLIFSRGDALAGRRRARFGRCQAGTAARTGCTSDL